MTFFVATTGLILLAMVLGRVLTEWLANRPEKTPEYSREEILEEMEAAFVARDILTFSVRPESVRILLQRLTESVGLGFGSQQAETLTHRMLHQQAHDYYQAAFPIEVAGQASDLEFQWTRDEDAIQIAICAVDPVLTFATDAAADIAIEHEV